jgi:hypothetical protein
LAESADSVMRSVIPSFRCEISGLMLPGEGMTCAFAWTRVEAELSWSWG